MIGACVIHICADYPDCFRPRNTPVIARLVKGLRERGRQIVISISRVNRLSLEAVVIDGDDWAIRYFAPPLGIMHHMFLKRLAGRILALLASRGVRADLFIGHKLTVESVVCMMLAKALQVPFVAAFMGNTDRKIFHAKPMMRRAFREAAERASSLVFPTPWTQRYFERRLLGWAADSPTKCHLIPYISGECRAPTMGSAGDSSRFVSIFRLDAWRLKNVERVIAALSRLRSSGKAWSLDVIGGGSARAVKGIEGVIRRHDAGSFVRLLGEKNRAEIDRLLPDYCAMVLPSFPESFGLVYLEALWAGVPIMTARNAGLDGYFENAFPGVVVPHQSISEIMTGLITLSRDSDLLRERIYKNRDNFEIFEIQSIVTRYENIIIQALA